MKEIGSKVGQNPSPTPNFCNFFSPSLSLPFQPLTDATISSSATSFITRSQHNYRSATIGLSLSLSLSSLLPSLFYCFPLSSCLRLRLEHHFFSGHTKQHQSGCQQHPQPRWTSSAILAYITTFVPFLQ